MLIKGHPVATATAIPWIYSSLSQGSALSASVRARIDPTWSAFVVAPGADSGPWRAPIDERSRQLRHRDVDDIATQFLKSLSRRGLQTLVVEDDSARRGDPNLGEAAYVDDRVLRWSELRGDTAHSVALLRSVAYPLNGFLCRKSASTMGLLPHKSLDKEERTAVAAATAVVIVSVYDAEAYLAIVAPDVLGARPGRPER